MGATLLALATLLGQAPPPEAPEERPSSQDLIGAEVWMLVWRTPGGWLVITVTERPLYFRCTGGRTECVMDPRYHAEVRPHYWEHSIWWGWSKVIDWRAELVRAVRLWPPPD